MCEETNNSYAFHYKGTNRVLLPVTDETNQVLYKCKLISPSKFTRIINKKFFTSIPPLNTKLVQYELFDFCNKSCGNLVLVLNLTSIPECPGSLQGTIWHIITIDDITFVAKSIGTNIQSRLYPQLDPRNDLLITHVAIIFSNIIGGSFDDKIPVGPKATFRDNQQLDLTNYSSGTISNDSFITIRNVDFIKEKTCLCGKRCNKECSCNCDKCCKRVKIKSNFRCDSHKTITITHGSFEYEIKGQNDFQYVIFNCKSITTNKLASILNAKFDAGIPPGANIVEAEIFDFCGKIKCGTVITFFAPQPFDGCPGTIFNFGLTIWEVISVPKGYLVLRTVVQVPPVVGLLLPTSSGNIIARSFSVTVPIEFIERGVTVVHDVKVTHTAPRVADIIGGGGKYKCAKGFMEGLTAQDTTNFGVGIITFSGDLVIYFD